MLFIRIRKTVSIILCILYAISLTLILSLGKDISLKLMAQLEIMLSEKNIMDVTVDISEDTELLAGKTYYPEFKPYGIYRGSPGLRYISLDPEYLTVGENGKLYANMDFDGDVLNARVLVSSAYDEDFQKIFTFRFVKRYPDNFSVSYSVKGYGKNTPDLYIGVPVYVFAEINAQKEYNMTDHTLVYDEEYFTLSDDGALIPLKATADGESLTFAVEYNDGTRRESEPFEIREATVCEDFDEIRLNGILSDEYVGKRSDTVEISLYKNGERLATDYTVSLAKTQDAKCEKDGGMQFLSAGEKEMTVTLPSGYYRTVSFSVENVILPPVFKDEGISTTHVINILDTDVKEYGFYFDGNVSYDTVTFEYAPELIKVSTSARAITVKGRGVGTTTLKIIIDDGYQRVEDVYTVNVRKNVNPVVWISENIPTFVSKVLGHISLFAIFAFFAMNMFKFVPIKSRMERFGVYTMIGLPVAALTEFIQYYIPGRISRVEDIMIDMLGFYFGTLMILLYRAVLSEVKNEDKVLIYEVLKEERKEVKKNVKAVAVAKNKAAEAKAKAAAEAKAKAAAEAKAKAAAEAKAKAAAEAKAKAAAEAKAKAAAEAKAKAAAEAKAKAAAEAKAKAVAEAKAKAVAEAKVKAAAKAKAKSQTEVKTTTNTNANTVVTDTGSQNTVSAAERKEK